MIVNQIPFSEARTAEGQTASAGQQVNRRHVLPVKSDNDVVGGGPAPRCQFRESRNRHACTLMSERLCRGVIHPTTRARYNAGAWTMSRVRVNSQKNHSDLAESMPCREVSGESSEICLWKVNDYF